MCLGNHVNPDRLDRISHDPMKDLFDLIDMQHSPVNNNCSYVLPDEIKNSVDLGNGSQYCILHLNIHSIPSKKDDLINLLERLKHQNITVDVLLICETFITDQNKDQCKLEGYKLYDEHRKKMTKGGVAVYVSERLQYIDRKDLNIFDEGLFESCFIEVKLRGKNTVIGEVYRIPGTNEVDFIKKYESIISKVQKEKKDIIIGTDQNLDYLKIQEHTNTAKFLEINLTNSLLPTISKPTRITHRTCTLIDNIYVSNSLGQNMKSMILTTDISDHLPCLTLLQNAKGEMNTPFNVTSRKLDANKMLRIKNSLKTVDWSSLENLGPDDGYNFVINTITQALDIIAPKKTVRINPSRIVKQPWMTNGLVQSAKSCDKMYKKVHGLDKNSPEYQRYKDFRNTYNKLKRKAKSKFYMDKIEEFKTNSKKLWSLLRSITGKSNDKSSFATEFVIGGSKISQPDLISNEFCKFYSTMGGKLASKIGPSRKPFTEYMAKSCDASIYLTPTNPTEICKIVSKMKNKNSTGFDGISNSLLKFIIHEIKNPLALIFNKSIEFGIFPEKMKLAKVIPIYKLKGERNQMVNYRPVSLLPVISKVLEKIVYKRIYKFLLMKELLYDSQFGFRTHHSTTDAILELVGKILKGYERKDYTLAVFLDLSKAFDTLSHETLLHKLENGFGIRGKALSWFKSYLSDRKMHVNYNGHTSELKDSTFGVPQGSVLGPLLFILLTNDINNALKKSQSILFADDTTIYVTHKNTRVLVDSMKHDLSILTDWFKANKLTLNLGKTSFILFRTKNMPEVQISLNVGDTAIHQETVTKFLGVHIDQFLSWDTHAKYVANRTAKNLYMLRNIQNLVPSWTLRNLYYSYVQSAFTYGLSAWGPLMPKSALKRLEILQKKALRIIDHAKYNAPSAPIFKKWKILNIADLIELEVTKISFRYVKNALPTPIKNLFQPNSYTHNYGTRFRNFPRTAKHKSSIFNKSFLVKAPSLWTSINVPGIAKKSMGSFKRQFVKLKLEKY